MGDLLLNPVGENMSKNYPSEGRQEKRPLALLSIGQRWPHMMLNPLLLDCDIGRQGFPSDKTKQNKQVAAVVAGVGGDAERFSSVI